MHSINCQLLIIPTSSFAPNRHITPPLSNFLNPLPNPRFEGRPKQQPRRDRDKQKNDQLILRRIPLETGGKDLLLRVLDVFADLEVIIEAELTVAVDAGLSTGLTRVLLAREEEEGGVNLGGGRGGVV